jgi:excisionase family DNA binding protein
MTELLTPDEFEDLCRLSPGTAVRLARRGDVPAVAIGKEYRFRKSDVENLLNGASAPGDHMRIDINTGNSGERSTSRSTSRPRAGRAYTADENDRIAPALAERLTNGLLLRGDANALTLVPRGERQNKPLEICDVYDELVKRISPDLAREAERIGRGEKTARLLSHSFATRASAAGLSTATLASLCANVGRRMILNRWRANYAAWRMIANVESTTDFRPLDNVLVSDWGAMQQVDENGEIRQLTLTDAKEQNQIAAFALGGRISLQALTNTGIEAVMKPAGAIASAYMTAIANKFFTLLLANAALTQDNVALFNATHGNIDSTAAALSQTQLGVAMKNFAKMVRLGPASQGTVTSDPNTPVGVRPKFLLVPPELDALARATMRGLLLDDAEDNISVLVEPRLSDAAYTGNSATAYYLFADPAVADLIQVLFLEGYETPAFETRPSRDILGLDFRAYGAFGCKVLDFRGMHKSVGA